MIPRVYIAGPYSAPTKEAREENFHRALGVGAVVLSTGCHPVIPHATGILLEHIQDSYEFWIEATLNELRTCHACVMVPGWTKSSGSRGEFADCVIRSLPVFEAVKTEPMQQIGLPSEFLLWLESVR